MCGRYLLDVPGGDLASHFGAENHLQQFEPSWNAAPSQPLPVVYFDKRGGTRVLEQLRWGLVPAWAARKAGPSRPFINARAETVATKPAFRYAFTQRRCVVPVSGFYEWHMDGDTKVPYCIRVVNQAVVPLAGIYERWVDGNGEVQGTYAIITTQPNETVGRVHDRMPAILAPEAIQPWLETPPGDARELLDLLGPYRGEKMEAFEVSRDVNNTRNDYPELARPTAA